MTVLTVPHPHDSDAEACDIEAAAALESEADAYLDAALTAASRKNDGDAGRYLRLYRSRLGRARALLNLPID